MPFCSLSMVFSLHKMMWFMPRTVVQVRIHQRSKARWAWWTVWCKRNNLCFGYVGRPELHIRFLFLSLFFWQNEVYLDSVVSFIDFLKLGRV